MAWDKASAADAGKKGAAVAAETKRRKKSDPMFAIKKSLPALMQDLLSAARGAGEWAALPLDKRLGALLKAIEYGLGKPVGVDKQSPKDVNSDDESSSTLIFE